MANNNKPVHEVRIGSVRASVWLNEGKNGPWHNVNGTVDMGAYEFQVDTPSIPTVSQWGMIVMTLLLLSAGTLILHQHGQRRCRATIGRDGIR